ncbi:hypothetical protein [Brevundimonas sp. R86498]|uniref:hypothetical protein n=1 Tax=Brevundimonas sp. R86498 TaxID=3093845 RepID=UPI0037C84B3F
MTFITLAAVVVALQAGWTWTLYEEASPVVLANEIPDTPRLKTVLECQPGSGVARLDLFGPNAGPGIATIVSGPASATGQSDASETQRSIALRTDHPVFGQFVQTGALDVAVAGRHQIVTVETDHLAKLRRFAELCGG